MIKFTLVVEGRDGVSMPGIMVILHRGKLRNPLASHPELR